MNKINNSKISGRHNPPLSNNHVQQVARFDYPRIKYTPAVTYAVRFGGVVPQESVLGPFMFIRYAADTSEIILPANA